MVFACFLQTPPRVWFVPALPRGAGHSLQVRRNGTLDGRQAFFTKTPACPLPAFATADCYEYTVVSGLSLNFQRTDSLKAEKIQKAGRKKERFPSFHAITVKNLRFYMKQEDQPCSVRLHFTYAINRAVTEAKRAGRRKAPPRKFRHSLRCVLGQLLLFFHTPETSLLSWLDFLMLCWENTV